MRIFYFLLICLVFAIGSCDNENNSASPTKNEMATNEGDNDIAKEKSIEEIAAEICSYLADEEFISIANYTDENQKIIFSPYLFIDKQNNQRLTIKEFQALFDSQEKVSWGVWDGKGGEINVPAHEYYHRFILRGDYCKEGELHKNELKVKGNALNNINEVFPNSTYISFYLPPHENDLAEMSWKTLVLVFDNNNYLVGILNHEWTI